MRNAKIALDTNLTLLLAVGRAQRGLVPVHKRLQQFSDLDYGLLQGFLAVSDQVITTPFSMAEISNLAAFGVIEPARSRVVASLKGLTEAFVEVYTPSKVLARRAEFAWLGLADCAWLAVLDQHTRLLTVDNALYLAALKLGHNATNFHHVADIRRGK